MTSDTTMTDVDTVVEYQEPGLRSRLTEARMENKGPKRVVEIYLADALVLLQRCDELELLARRMLEAIDAGTVDSQEIDIGDPDIPPHKFHEEWQHHASETLAKLKARP